MAYAAAIASLVTTVTSIYSSFDQGRTQKQIFESNQNAAIRSAIDQYDALGAQANQRREAAGQQATQNALAAARARATAATAAEGSGISGSSVDQIVNEISGQEAKNYTDIAANEAYAQDQATRVGKGITAQAQDRINSVAPGGFNPIVGLLQIGAGATDAYMQTPGFKAKYGS